MLHERPSQPARWSLSRVVMTAVGGGTAVAQSPAAPVSFTYMTFVPQETDQVGSCIDEYTALHPNVTIDYQIVDHDALQQKLVTEVETNTLPDMFWWNGTLIVDAANKSQSVLDLSPYLDDAFKANLIDDALANLTNADGKIVGFPANAEIQGWVFNKALFDKYNLAIPTTYDELKAALYRSSGRTVSIPSPMVPRRAGRSGASSTGSSSGASGSRPRPCSRTTR